MRSILTLLLGTVVGVVGGSFVNMGLIIVGSELIPPPPGIDVTDAESLRAAADLLAPRHFIFPFIAHAGGTLVGCLAASLATARYPRLAALLAGCLFQLGGIVNAFMIPAPAWFLVLDLALAYIPMALLALLMYQRMLRKA